MSVRMPQWLPLLCRSVAILIAVAAVVDPSVESLRRTRPVVSLVTADSVRDHALSESIANTLARRFTVVRGILPGAEATVMVGSDFPAFGSVINAPVLVVDPAAERAFALRRIESPERVSLDARGLVVATLQHTAHDSTRRDSVAVELTQDNVVLSRAVIALPARNQITATLDFVPTQSGPTVLQLRAFQRGAGDTLRHDIVVHVDSARWAVLFHDQRPSWMSTFVRRALESDTRFAVTTRIATSTNVSRETGRPPQTLVDLASNARYDVIVVGAPESLSQHEVAALNTLLRVRGASVVVLPDHATTGPINALLGIGRWMVASRRNPTAVARAPNEGHPSDSVLLRGVSIGVPAELPASATVIANVRVGGTGALPVIWRVPVGLGTLVVSGAFDAWRYREPPQSAFNAAWRDIIDDAAHRRVPPLAAHISPSLATPRALVRIVVTLRDSTASLPVLSDAIALLPSATADQREAEFRAPAKVGRHEVVVSMGTDTLRVPLLVAASVAHDANPGPERLHAWAASRGGRVIPRRNADSLSSMLTSLIDITPRMSTWHPMRSAWWIVPFALLLSTEWWLRRRRGQS